MTQLRRRTPFPMQRLFPFIATAGRISRKAARTSNTRSKLLASPRACGCLNPAFPQRCHLAAGIVLSLTRPRTRKIRLNVRFSPKATELLRGNTEAIAVRALLRATLQQKCPKLVERGLALARTAQKFAAPNPSLAR